MTTINMITGVTRIIIGIIVKIIVFVTGIITNFIHHFPCYGQQLKSQGFGSPYYRQSTHYLVSERKRKVLLRMRVCIE